MKIKAYRTTMPFDNRTDTGGEAALSTPSNRSVMPFNNVHTIQDVLDGRRYDSLHGGSDWSDEEVKDPSFRENADDYKRLERDTAILNKMMDNVSHRTERWQLKVDGGSIYFPSLDSLRKYVRDNHVSFRYVTRVAQAQSNETQQQVNVIPQVIDKCFLIESMDITSNLKEEGAAFCIAPQHLVTCAHVIKKYDKTNIKDKGLPTNVFVHVVTNGTRLACSVKDINYELDIAILYCEELTSDPLQIDTEELKLGEDVICIGSPHGFENTVSVGTVGAVNRRIFTHDGSPLYNFFDLSVFPGNSGGPVIRETNGKVVGLMTMIIGSGNGAPGLNAGLPASYIESFCEKIIIK